MHGFHMYFQLFLNSVMYNIHGTRAVVTATKFMGYNFNKINSDTYRTHERV
jgi:hypothetical protein